MTDTTRSQELPRVLVLAADEITADYSTGITVANLFKDWPRDRLSQVCLIPGSGHGEPLTRHTAVLPSQGGLLDVPVRWGLRTLRSARQGWHARRAGQAASAAVAAQPGDGQRPHASLAALLELGPIRIDRRTAAFVREAAPDVIYSPMSGIRMMRLGERLSRLTGAPVVPHLLDDWPTTLYEHHELGGRAEATMAGLLETTLRGAPGIGVISDAMAQEYHRRYGVTSTPLMNCVDTLGTPKAAATGTGPVRFAYVGGLHLGRAQLLTRIADAVDRTPRAELLVHAPQDDLDRHRSLFTGFSSVRYGPSLEAGEVPGVLAGADVLVHLESFDEATARYTRLSVSTKIPQYLAAARPVLALGPGTLASMQHLHASGAALVVDTTDSTDLVHAVASLADSPALRQSLSEAGVRFAAAHHHAPVVRAQLTQLLRQAVQ